MDIDSVPDAKLDQTFIFVALVNYLGSKSYRGTLSNLKLPLQTEWIPITLLTTFSKLSSFSVKDVSQSIISFQSSLFELDLECLHIRRKTEFESEKVLKDLESHLSNYNITVYGFETSTTILEVVAYFNQHISIKSCSKTEKGAFTLEIGLMDDVIKALSMDHLYEESHLLLKLSAKTSYELPNTKFKCATNRIIEFQITNPVDHLTASQKVREQFEKLGKVQSVIYESSSTFGFVKFRKSIAKEALASAFHIGGLFLNDEQMQLRCLTGSEEHIWNETLVLSKGFLNTPVISKKKNKRGQVVETHNNNGQLGKKKRSGTVGKKRKETSNITDMIAALSNL
jgi:hypothetical protein